MVSWINGFDGFFLSLVAGDNVWIEEEFVGHKYDVGLNDAIVAVADIEGEEDELTRDEEEEEEEEEEEGEEFGENDEQPLDK